MPLAPVVSTLARQTFKTAFQDLSQTITPGDSQDFSNVTIQHVREECLEIEKHLAARQSLRSMRRLMPLFQGLEHYSKVVDVLCNGTPYLPWIWAPISLILRISSEYIEAFEHIIKAYASIAASLQRFATLNKAFIRDVNFQHTLSTFYADILQFHKHAYCFVRRSGWKLLFLTSWGRFQRRFGNILEDLERHDSLVDKEANAINIAESRRIRDEITEWKEKSLTKMKQSEQEETTRWTESITSWMKIDESDQLRILESISAEGDEYPGTCMWFQKNHKFQSWCMKRPDTPVLWFQGSAGSGKSVLMAQILKFMRISKCYTISHFCSSLYSFSTIYEEILKSLLIQLIRKDDELVAHVYKKFVLEKKSPTVSCLEHILQTLLKSISSNENNAGYIWVFIDGFDECQLEKQQRLLFLLNRIVNPSQQANIICKILVSSRTSSNLLDRLRKRQIISMGEEREEVRNAIQTYVSQRLDRLHHNRFYDLELDEDKLKKIQDAIVDKSDGMFLYARLVLDQVSRNVFLTAKEIMSSVKMMPEGLTDFYRQILTQILDQLDRTSCDRIRCVLGWVAFAKRPLKRIELLSAVSFSLGDLNIHRLVPQYMLDMCGSLVEEKPDSTLVFIQMSVKEFLQTAASGKVAIQEEHALLEHGTASVSCLLSGSQVFQSSYPEQAKSLRVIKGVHSLHVYATEYWTEYILSLATLAGGLDLNSPFFALACQLADQIRSWWGSNESININRSQLLDSRLSHLQSHPKLYCLVGESLAGRSLRKLEVEFFKEHNPSEASAIGHSLPPMHGPEAILESYQRTLRTLIALDNYDDVTNEEFKLFKRNLRNSAFTCRLRNCSGATLGFESERLLRHHEMSHVRCFRCDFPNCPYPPLFSSSQRLEEHRKKYHSPPPDHKPIRSRRNRETSSIRAENRSDNAQINQNDACQVRLYDMIDKEHGAITPVEMESSSGYSEFKTFPHFCLSLEMKIQYIQARTGLFNRQTAEDVVGKLVDAINSERMENLSRCLLSGEYWHLLESTLVNDKFIISLVAGKVPVTWIARATRLQLEHISRFNSDSPSSNRTSVSTAATDEMNSPARGDLDEQQQIEESNRILTICAKIPLSDIPQ